MTSSAGSPKPPASPPAPEGPSLKSAWFYWLPRLPNHSFSRRIHCLDSTCTPDLDFFSNLNPDLQPPQHTPRFSPLSILVETPPSTHTHTQCLVNDPPAAPLRAPRSLRARPQRRLPSSRPGLRLHTPRPPPRPPTSLPLPPRARVCSARWLPQQRMSDPL